MLGARAPFRMCYLQASVPQPGNRSTARASLGALVTGIRQFFLGGSVVSWTQSCVLVEAPARPGLNARDQAPRTIRRSAPEAPRWWLRRG